MCGGERERTGDLVQDGGFERVPAHPGVIHDVLRHQGEIGHIWHICSRADIPQQVSPRRQSRVQGHPGADEESARTVKQRLAEGVDEVVPVDRHDSSVADAAWLAHPVSSLRWDGEGADCVAATACSTCPSWFWLTGLTLGAGRRRLTRATSAGLLPLQPWGLRTGRPDRNLELVEQLQHSFGGLPGELLDMLCG